MSPIEKSEIIVIKIGSSTLSSLNPSGGINTEIVSRLCETIDKLKNSGYKILLVTSGAVALGMKKLQLDKKPKTVTGKQVAAAVGQAELMQIYEKYFSKYKITIAQVLLTREGFQNRDLYINARETILELLDMNVIPIINENDVVASEEIRFGDNDMLSALVSDLISADRLFILTDEDGLYDKNPKKNKNAKLISVVERVTPQTERIATGAGTDIGTGGMLSKVLAAKLATSVGIQTHVINGKSPENILEILKGKEFGTTFLPFGNKIEKRKSWIAHTLISSGKIFVDRGAQKAIHDEGKSLLPSGIKKIFGTFDRGATVDIYLLYGNKPFAKGITNYGKHELEKISGLKSSEISKILGYTYGETVIHRDDLVVMN